MLQAMIRLVLLLCGKKVGGGLSLSFMLNGAYLARFFSMAIEKGI
jgi:hypothetical protein